MDPNVLGYVVEVVEDLDPIKETSKVTMRIVLRNTLGKEMVIWVDAPSSVSNFFTAETPTVPGV